MKITAGEAVIKVLESWKVKHLYGIPGSSVNGLMKALDNEKNSIEYIQVRHESAGAMAATAFSKFSGEIGVCFGSAGPGGSNLLNGLYDAKMDRVPLLALVGQVPSISINTNFFQEMDEVPLYADVSVYNKMVTNPQQIPNIIEEAIRMAYSHNGVSVVILPNDFMETEIDYSERLEVKKAPEKPKIDILKEDVDKVLDMIKNSKNPVIYGGLGLKDAGDTVIKFSERFSMPIVTSVPSIGLTAPYNHKNFMGSFGRLGTKPAFEAINYSDLILFVGSNFPFARYWDKSIKIIQINNEIADIGKQIKVNMGIVADGKEFLEKLLESDYSREETEFLKATQINKRNWDKWLDNIASDDIDGLTPEGVIKAVKEYSTEDAFYGLDVGNNTIHSIRLLPLDGKRRHVLSGWFATLGVALPYSISAKLTFPNRQVWSISGDGGFAMNMQEIITQTKYELSIINIVLSNESYGFIQHAQILSKFEYGVDISETDWAKTAEGMGAISFTVRNLKELKETMEKIKDIQAKGNKKPILIDAKSKYFDTIDTSNIIMDPDKYSKEQIEEFTKTYNVFGQPSLSEILKDIM